jgi:hypothetical protein
MPVFPEGLPPPYPLQDLAVLRLFCGGKVNGPVILIAEADAVGVEWIC